MRYKNKTKRVGRGRLVGVMNKAGRFGAAKEYVFTFLRGEGGDVPYLFTQAQLDVAEDRAAKNPEDLLPRRKFFFF
tara:strand:+ start:4243 stop:4470 length:228 start_codon:yes stop_codon:yes gene_type:complete